MKKILLVLALLLAIPAAAQFDPRTTGTREQKYLIFNAAPSLPSVSAPQTALFVYDPACNCIKVSENGGGWWTLNSGGGGGGSGVSSFNGRTGAVLSASGDYTATQVSASPFLTITGTTVQSQLQQLDARITASTSASVTSVFGRTGAVTAASGDYTATQVTAAATGDVASTTVQAAIAELASEKVNASSASTISGLKTFSSTSGLKIQPASMPLADTKLLDVRNASAVSVATVDLEGDVAATTVTTTGAATVGGLLTANSIASTTGGNMRGLVGFSNAGADTFSVGSSPAISDSSPGFTVRRANVFPLTGSYDVMTIRSSDNLSTWLYPVVFTSSVDLKSGATASTPATDDNDTSIATTAFVKSQAYATLASPVFTGDPTAPTAAAGDNDTSIATTGFVTNAITSSVAGVASFNTRTGAVVPVQADYDSFFTTQAEGDARWLQLTGGTITGSVTATNLTASTNVSVGNQITFTANATTVSTNSIYRQAVLGMVFRGSAGSTNDLSFYNSATQQVMVNPTGTQNMTFLGTATIPSTILSSATPITMSGASPAVSHTGTGTLDLTTAGTAVRVHKTSAAGADFHVLSPNTTTVDFSVDGATAAVQTRGKLYAGNTGSAATSSTTFEAVGGSSAGVSGTTPVASFVDSTTAAANVGGNVGFFGKYTTGGAYAQFAQLGGFKANGTDSDPGGTFRVATRTSAGTLTEALTINDGQDVGIGTTTPSTLSNAFAHATSTKVLNLKSAAIAAAALDGTSTQIDLVDSDYTANLRMLRVSWASDVFLIRSQNDAGGARANLLTMSGDGTSATFSGSVATNGRATGDGNWTSPAYSGASFTAATGTWTVDAVDVTTLAYSYRGKTMLVAWTIAGTDVSAAATSLRIAIPDGKTAAKTMYTNCVISDAGAATTACEANVTAAGTTISIAKIGGAAFTITSADNTAARGQIEFEIQ